MNKTYVELKHHIIEKLHDDDIVLDIKILNISILDWNILLDYLSRKDNVDFFYASLKKAMPINVNQKFFEDENVKLITISLNSLEINLPFFDFDEIEFYTGSVINMDEKDFFYLFEFVKEISEVIKKNVSIYIENMPNAIIKYNLYESNFEIL